MNIYNELQKKQAGECVDDCGGQVEGGREHLSELEQSLDENKTNGDD